MTDDRKLWFDLQYYYEQHGVGEICCCPVEQYSSEVFYFEELSGEDPSIGHILEQAHFLVKQAGYAHEVYQIEVICTSVLGAFLMTNKVCCAFLLDTKKVIISDEMIDFIKADYDRKSVCVFFWTH